MVFEEKSLLDGINKIQVYCIETHCHQPIDSIPAAFITDYGKQMVNYLVIT